MQGKPTIFGRLLSFLKSNWGWILVVIMLAILANDALITWRNGYLMPSTGTYVRKPWYLLGLLLPLAATIYFTAKLVGLYKRFKVERRPYGCQKYSGSFIDRAIAYMKVPIRENIRLLVCMMLVIWSVGWMGYYLAILSDYGHAHDLGELIFYSAACSLGTFMMDLNGNVLDACPSPAIRYFVIVVGLCAAMSTVSVVLSLFLSRYSSYRHMKLLAKDEYDEVYVFFGINAPSLRMAESIRQHSGCDDKYLIVFVEESDVEEDETDGWSSIQKLFSHRKKTMSSIELDAHTALVVAEKPLTEVADHNTGVWKQLNLAISLGSILMRGEHSQRRKHYFFLLSDDREGNATATINLANNVDLRSTQVPTVIYCHTRNGALSRNLENSLPQFVDGAKRLAGRVEVKVLDYSRLSVAQIKSDPLNQPIRFVDIDAERNPGTVSSPFNSLIIGFGETGQDMTRFLYEFGAFVDSRSTEDRTFRSPFHCHVVDQNMDMLMGKFKAEAPNVDSEEDIRDNGGEPLITYHACDCHSDEFYQNVLIPLSAELNYVVVALGDNETNMSVAIDILKIVRRYRKDLDKFRIFVRINDADNAAQIDEVSQYYNSILGEDVICAFGAVKDLLTYDLIINDRRTTEAENYFTAYNQISAAYDGTSEDWGRKWHERYKQARGKIVTDSGEGEIESPASWHQISVARNQEAQDYSNADHGYTKAYIIEQVTKREAEDFADKIFGSEPYRIGNGHNIEYVNLTDTPREQKLVDNLAKLEHIRWNACQEMLGFVYGEKKCYRQKTHNCLTHWQNVPVGAIIYDYMVTETTLRLIQKH